MVNGSERENNGKSTIVVVATYNERDNIVQLASEILKLDEEIKLLFVDDNSPDGTGILADKIAERNERVKVLHRPAKEGLASALIEGFRWALEQKADFVVNLDGDLSHDPRAIPVLAEIATHADLVIGSRYANGIRVINWSQDRLLLSLLAAHYVRLITRLPFMDPTSGFRCFRRNALKLALQNPITATGFSFHIEILYRIWRDGLRVLEAPIVFKERMRGSSKMNSLIVLEAFGLPWRLLFQHCVKRCLSANKFNGSDRRLNWFHNGNRTHRDDRDRDGVG